MCAEQALPDWESARRGTRAGSVSTWAMLITRVYEVYPLECPHSSSVVRRTSSSGSFGTAVSGKAPSARRPPSASKPCPAEAGELEVVLDDEFLKLQRRENQPAEPGEAQLVLDHEFLLPASDVPGQWLFSAAAACARDPRPRRANRLGRGCSPAI